MIGVVPDESNLYPELTGFENLCFCAALYGMGKSERPHHSFQAVANAFVPVVMAAFLTAVFLRWIL